MNTSGSIAESVYSGAATVGKIQATMGLIVGGIVAICMCIVGFFLVRSEDKLTEKTKAIVQNAKCTETIVYEKNKNRTTYDCNLEVAYIVNNVPYVEFVKTTTKYNTGESLEISYNPTNPKEIAVDHIPPKVLGVGSSVVAIIIILSVGLHFYFAKKYEPYAAVQGAMTTVDIAKKIF